ncbi:MAG: twin-arginine translocase TatA/TatE family subunit [Anaerolineales bacterium]|nr:twin-arginine translocase TatA/TatE family subunit [Anaerolineales bacterium]
MDVLGIGPLELMFVLLIALIIIGPKDMTKTARSAGRFLNRMYRSETWRALTEASRTIQTLPNRLAREAQIEELEALRKDLDGTAASAKPDAAQNPALKPWITPYDGPDQFKTIAPPRPEEATPKTSSSARSTAKPGSAAKKPAGKKPPASKKPAAASQKSAATKSASGGKPAKGAGNQAGSGTAGRAKSRVPKKSRARKSGSTGRKTASRSGR